jgi:hypothetical protein
MIMRLMEASWVLRNCMRAESAERLSQRDRLPLSDADSPARNANSGTLEAQV